MEVHVENVPAFRAMMLDDLRYQCGGLAEQLGRLHSAPGVRDSKEIAKRMNAIAQTWELVHQVGLNDRPGAEIVPLRAVEVSGDDEDRE
ncbi:MAG: hypothetical protein ACRDKE_06415 [Solirubrobacterales bacterium]